MCIEGGVKVVCTGLGVSDRKGQHAGAVVS